MMVPTGSCAEFPLFQIWTRSLPPLEIRRTVTMV